MFFPGYYLVSFSVFQKAVYLCIFVYSYINVDGPAVRKTSANIDLTIFNETKKSSKKDEETARREAKKSVFSDPAVDDLIEKQIQAQVHHQDPTAPKTKSHAGVRFGPLPTETEEIDEMNTAC